MSRRSEPSTRSRRRFAVALALGAMLAACGARTELLGQRRAAGEGGAGGAGCVEGAVEPCGSDVGECAKGHRTCHDGVLGPCEGVVGLTDETCNGKDDNCDGQVDEGFGLGAACDGPDSDLCTDDVMTCNGCSPGPDDLEICNGLDDNCNGVIDSDCEVGDCQPTLEVTGSTPSDPSCIDFPVQAGSKGTIQYPCAGGPVTATLGDVSFTGTVVDGFVSLDGTASVLGPDGCTWETSHHIEGVVSQGMLSYSYAEAVIVQPPGIDCWSPCTETGTVKITWMAAP